MTGKWPKRAYVHKGKTVNGVDFHRLRRGLSVKKLAEIMGSSVFDLTRLISGDLSPCREDGSARETVQRMCDFFELPLSELFPDYEDDARMESIPFRLASETMAENPEDICVRNDFWNRVFRLAEENRNDSAFLKMWLSGETHEKTAEALGYSREHVSGVLGKLFRRMRDAALKLEGKDARTEKRALPDEDDGDWISQRQIARASDLKDIEHDRLMVSKSGRRDRDDFERKRIRSAAEQGALRLLLFMAGNSGGRLRRENVDDRLRACGLPCFDVFYDKLKRRSRMTAESEEGSRF